MGLKPGRADILYIYRKLVSSFSRIKGFSGWMIAKAEFKMSEDTSRINRTGADGTIPAETGIIKQRKNYAVISSCAPYKNMEYTIIMYIVKPGDTIIKKPNNTDVEGIVPEDIYQGSSYLFTLKYTAEDIRRFTEHTGDRNPIHQMAAPVVPGFLMFGDVIGNELYKYANGSSIKFVISFRNPVFADEPAEVYKLDGNGKIIAVNPSCKWEADIVTGI